MCISVLLSLPLSRNLLSPSDLGLLLLLLPLPIESHIDMSRLFYPNCYIFLTVSSSTSLSIPTFIYHPYGFFPFWQTLREKFWGFTEDAVILKIDVSVLCFSLHTLPYSLRWFVIVTDWTLKNLYLFSERFECLFFFFLSMNVSMFNFD